MPRLFSHRLPVCFLFLFCLSLPGQDSANPGAGGEQITVVRAGAVSIALPSPSPDLVEAGPDYRVVLEPLAPVANRLIAGFVMPEKLEAIHAGNVPQMDEYALIEVPRRAEFANIDPATFKQVTDAVGKQFGGDMSASWKSGLDALNQTLKGLGSSAAVTLGQPIKLGTFFSKADAVGFGMVAPYSVNGTTTKMASVFSVLRVRNRVLFSYTFAVYKDEGTVKWLRTTSEHWADAILKANP